MAGSGTAEIILRLVGVFYAFAGIVGVRAALSSRLIDIAIAALDNTRANKAKTGRALWLLIGALLVLSGGAALMLLMDASAWLFGGAALGQALYLFAAAPFLFDPCDPPDATGRNQTYNAFVLYLLATALVIWAAYTGKLVSWSSVPWPFAHVAALAVAVFAIDALAKFARPFAARS
jgi:hypothetical protein